MQGLRCEIDDRMGCGECPYSNCIDFFECSGPKIIMREALELLKAQESVKPKKWIPRRQTIATVRGYYCPVCDTSVVRRDKYCHECGRELDWHEDH